MVNRGNERTKNEYLPIRHAPFDFLSSLTTRRSNTHVDSVARVVRALVVNVIGLLTQLRWEMAHVARMTTSTGSGRSREI